MKLKRIIVSFLLLVIALVSGTAYASFVVKDEKEIWNDELQNQTITSNYVTLDYNNQETPDAHYYLSSSGSLSNIDNYAPSVEREDHIFAGWATTKSGFDYDGNSTIVDPKTETFSGGETLYAKYYNDASQYTFGKLITSGINIAPSSDSVQKKVYLSANDEVTDQIVLTSSFQVYYDSTSTEYSTTTFGTDETVKRPNEAGSLIVLDCDLIIDGGTFQLNSISCQDGGAFCNTISDAFSALDLNGYNIYIRNSGTLLGYGLIYNSKDTGGIIVENGEIRSIFTPIDFKGGGPTTVSYGNCYAVFSGFTMPYLAVETILTKDGTLSADCSLFANKQKYNSTPVVISSSNAVLNIKDGYVIRRTTPYLELINDIEEAQESNFLT